MVCLQRYLVATRLVPHETAVVSVHGQCTPHNHAPGYSHFIQHHIDRVYVCLAITCHLHFRQIDGIFYMLLWEHRVRTVTKIGVSTESWPCPPLLWGLKPTTFQSRVQRSSTELTPLPSLKNGCLSFSNYCLVWLSIRAQNAIRDQIKQKYFLIPSLPNRQKAIWETLTS